MGKSPFAQKEVYTYNYPDPLDPKKEDEQSEANPDSFVRRIDPEEMEEGHWVKFRIPRSKKDVDAVADYTQSLVHLGGNGDGASVEQKIARGNLGVFELLAEDWSFDAECNGANFARLTDWSGDWITACLADVVGKGTARDYAKKTKNSSKTPEVSEIAPLEPQPTE